MIGFELFKDALDMPKKYQYLRTRLVLEQSRLLNWGEQIGLLEEVLQKPSQALRLSRNLVLDILLEMHEAFRSCLKITAKYEILAIGINDTVLGATRKQTVFLQKARKCWTGMGNMGARLQWAMVKSDAFEGMILRIMAFNERMECLLDHSDLNELRFMQEKSNLLLLQLTEQVTQLTDLTKSLDIRSEGTPGLASSFSRSSTLGPDDSDQGSLLGALAAFKMHVTHSSRTTATKENAMRLGHDLVEIGDELLETGRVKAMVAGQRAWIEWRTLLEDQPDPEYVTLIESRLSALAGLLGDAGKPADLRTPHCLGYYCDEQDVGSRYGLVFHVPIQYTAMTSSMRTLRRHFNQSRLPPLSTRIALTMALVESIMYLHAVNWLHKGFRSDNVLFLLAVDRNLHDSDLLMPVVSGFDFSRPDESDQTTVKSTSSLSDEYYKHPQLLSYSSARSSKTHDIYALGVVLVEIALWKPIESVMEVCFGKKVTRSMCPRIRERLLAGPFGDFENVLSAVSAQAGDTYASATKRCLTGGKALGIESRSNQEDAQTSSKLQETFYDEIYLKLKSIHI